MEDNSVVGNAKETGLIFSYGMECSNNHSTIDNTQNASLGEQPPNHCSFFFPRLETSTDSAPEMNEFANALVRDSTGCSGISSGLVLAISSGCANVNADSVHDTSLIDSAQQEKMTDGSLFDTSYDNNRHYVTNTNHKPLEPSDVYGRVSCNDGKISLQLRLLNLSTNFPINVSECWLCRNKVHGSSPLYVHKHNFSGVFQVNDEYVNLIISDDSSNSSLNSKQSTQHTDFTPNEGFASNDSGPINDMNNSAISSDNNTLPYMNSNSNQFPVDKRETADSTLSALGWSQNKSYFNYNNQNSLGYNIHSAVDNIYSKTNTGNRVNYNSVNNLGNTGKNSTMHSLNSPVPENLSRKTEIGAKRRKSKAQKKLSVIRMRTELVQNSEKKYPDLDSHTEKPHYSPEKPANTSNLPSFSPNCADSTQLKNSQKQLSSNYSLVKHILEKTEHLICNFCGKTFYRNFSEYKNHLVQEHDQSPKSIYGCPICFTKFGKNKHLVQHVKTHLGVKAFKCDQCGTKYGREESLKRHLMVHSKKKPYSCSICPKTFSRSEYLVAHLKAHSRSKHICDKCGIVCSTKFNLSVHLKVHTNVKPFVCELCNKSFLRNDFLDNHMEVVHKKNKPKCDICGKKFSRMDVLKRHEKMHMNVSFDCKFCMKSFTRKDRLLAHKRTHGINNELKCSKCPAAFKRRDVLQKHEKLHLQKEQCPICYKFISSKKKLEIHLELHAKNDSNTGNDTVKNSNKCEHCGKVFARRDLLTKHINKLHRLSNSSTEANDSINSTTNKRQKAFICDICSKGFTRSCNLRTHILKAHPVSAARRQRNSETIGEYNEEEYDEDDPDGIDRLNTALHKSRHTQSNNLVDLSSWTSGQQNSLESVIRHHTGNFSNSVNTSHPSLLAVTNTGDSRDEWHPRAPSVSPPPSLPGNLSLPQLSTQHPHSPINLSAEAITAAAYLLAYPSYLGGPSYQC